MMTLEVERWDVSRLKRLKRCKRDASRLMAVEGGLPAAIFLRKNMKAATGLIEDEL